MKKINFINRGAVKNNLSLEGGFEKFINQKIALSMSDYTIRYYTKRTQQFFEYLKKTTKIKYVHEITDDEINDFIASMRKQNPDLSNSTINNYLRAIRCIMYYFMEKGYTPYYKIRLVKAKNKPKDGYTHEEQEKL